MSSQWREDFDQLIFRGSWFMANLFPQEVVVFHRRTRTLLLADLILNFETGKVGGVYRWLLRFAGAADPDGRAPIDLRLLTLLAGKDDARLAFERMVTWKPERVIMAHVSWYDRNGTALSDGLARRSSSPTSRTYVCTPETCLLLRWWVNKG